MPSVLVVGLTLLSVVVAANLTLTLMLVRRIDRLPSPHRPPNMEVGLSKGTPAPDFRAETLAGDLVTRADYAGKPVSLIFMSSICPPCVEKIPALHSLAPKAQQAGVDLVLVLGDTNQAAGATFVERHRITLPVLIAPFDKSSFLPDYKAHGMPSHCTLNQQGVVETAGLLGPDWQQELVGTWAAMHIPAHQQ